MNTFFLIIVVFLILLALFDLVVGVSNDAVNFLNSAIGAKVASFKVIVMVAAVGVFAGAAMSNGMMDVARHGIMMPEYFSFYDVMCVFLAVMLTDVILLDIFNTLGMPTSTTVSMVFELLGGAFAIALIKIMSGATDDNGVALTLGDLLNTEKALSVIIGIFLSVAIAFVLGTLVQWIARMVFTFTYRVNGTTTSIDKLRSEQTHNLFSSSLKIGVFAGIAVTGIIWFLLINGLKGSSFMTPELKAAINENTWLILGGGLLIFSVIMTILSALKLPVLKFVVLLGTFALAMAFAGNDLVNFIGVPLTGYDAYNDFMTNGNGDSTMFYMKSLMGSAQTPTAFLAIAGLVMVLSLVFSKKAQNVVKTSVDLSRQDEGDEMFGSSAVARVLVRNSQKIANTVSEFIPKPVGQWIDKRFNPECAVLAEGAAFDHIRASVNLVLAGILVAFGTSMKLPLSTTYVTFMVAMGTSLADRAWSRESAVFRITGVLSVIGGWFITAGAAFIVCYLVTNAMVYGSFVAMAIAITLAIFILLRSNIKYKMAKQDAQVDVVFKQLVVSRDKEKNWQLLKQHVGLGNAEKLQFASECYEKITDAFLHEDYRTLRLYTHKIETAMKQLKRQRRREIIGLRKIDHILAVEKNTWYFLSNNAIEQLIYSLKRINDSCREHVGNNFSPVDYEYTNSYIKYQQSVVEIMEQVSLMMESPSIEPVKAAALRERAEMVQVSLSEYRKQIIDSIQQQNVNIASATVFLSIIQESQQILSCLRHMTRGMVKFM